jgi:hypothetical protein
VTIAQKAALSLLLSVLLFAGIAGAAYTGLFDLIETRFYNPSIARTLIRETGRDAEVIQDFVYDLQRRFEASLNEPPVRRSFLPRQSAADVYERTGIYKTLHETVSGLHSVRFVDSMGSRIHFSTYSPDVSGSDRFSIIYRDYHADPDSLPYGQVQVPAQGGARLIPDIVHGRIIFSFPFYDSLDLYRGTALFTLSLHAVAERLINTGRIRAGENISLTAAPLGIVSGIPEISRTEMLGKVASVWNDGLLGIHSLVSTYSKISLVLVSAKTKQGLYCGRLVNEEVFAVPPAMKVILLAAAFLTIYLTVFFLFNLRQDTPTVIQNRLKKLQLSLIEEFYERKGDMDWAYWIRELEERREDIRAELKRGVKKRQGAFAETEIDSFIDKSWDELLAFIGGRRVSGVIDEEKLRSIVNRMMRRYVDGNAEKLEELEVVDESDGAAPVGADVRPPAAKPARRRPGGLLAAATKKQFQDVEVVSPFPSILSSLGGDSDVIVEQNGVHFINNSILKQDAAGAKLDNQFKSLVESVIEKK